MDITQLKTPALLVNKSKLQKNAQFMLEKASKMQVKLRPHVKTHKSIEIAQIQLGGASGPIAVSTLAEAQGFSKAGFKDITYAVPVVAPKLHEVADIMSRGVRLHLLVDSVSTANDLQRFARTNNLKLSVFLKVDCGYHRAGVDPQASSSIELAKLLATASHLDFRGILTHAGHSYHSKSIAEVQGIAQDEQRIMFTFASALKSAKISCPEISVGSTPTCIHAEKWHDITEMRPGNYIFFDKFQTDIGSCQIDNCAATVLTRIVGKYPERRQIIVDAGSLALSKDTGATHVQSETVFGAVKGYPHLKIKSLSQEHGIISDLDGTCALEIGNILEIVPNHSCLAAAQHQTYHVVEGSKVVDEWRPVRGW